MQTPGIVNTDIAFAPPIPVDENGDIAVTGAASLGTDAPQNVIIEGPHSMAASTYQGPYLVNPISTSAALASTAAPATNNSLWVGILIIVAAVYFLKKR